jgi:hypothetical protein
MSVQHANRGVVKKDLQLYYNREFIKSFRGEATSNLIMNPNDANYYQGLYNFTVTPNAEIAPDGTNNAWSLAWNGTAFNYYSKNFPISNSTVYTTSVFAKAGTHNVIWVGISNMSGGENNASFNLTTGVATNGSPASTSCSMVYYGNGWWRCITTNTSGTSGAATTAMTVSIGSGRASLGTVYFWGFQAEKKSYATPFLDSLNPIRNQAVTNLYSADPYDGFDLISTYNYQGSTGATISVVSGIINPINSPTVMRYYTGTTGYQYFALTKSGLSSGTYTVSYYARLASGGPTGLTNTQLWRDGGTDLSVEGDWNPTFYTYWRRFRTTASVTSGTLHFFPIHGGSIAGGSIVYYTGFQLESGSEPKSFTPSSVSTINTIAAGGGLLDISGNNTNANLTNVVFDSAGYYFTSAGSNYVNTGIITLPSNTQLTIDIWTKPTSTTQQKTLISKWGSSADFNFCFLLFLNWFAQGNIYFLVGSANGDGYSTHSIPHNLSTSAYTNYTIVYDNGNISWYRNGVFIQTDTNGNQRLRSVTTPITIGADYDGGAGGVLTRSYDGIIPNVRLYSRPLTADEILQNFNATRKTYGI